MINVIKILGFVLVATLSVFGAINMFRQIKKLPDDEN
jgi:hypothetical protein